jgi:hypothetical protein
MADYPAPAPPPARRALLLTLAAAAAVFVAGFTAGLSTRRGGDSDPAPTTRLRVLPHGAGSTAAAGDDTRDDVAFAGSWSASSAPTPATAAATASGSTSPAASASASAAATSSASPSTSASASAAATSSPSRAATPSASAPATPDVGGPRPHCGGIAPLPGTFNHAAPPHFFPDPAVCPVPPVFTATEFVRCMAARKGRVFFAGNSIARAFGFALHSLLNEGTPEANRTAQKEICSKVADGRAESCTLAIPVPPEFAEAYPPEDARISIDWRAAMYRTDVQTDFCGGGPPEECYRHFFRGESRPGDVLIANIGLGYIEGARGHGAWGGAGSIPGIVADFERFLDSRLFNGTFIWSTVTMANPVMGSYGSFNPDMTLVNDAVVPMLQARRLPFVHMRSFAEHVPPEEAFVDASELHLSRGWVCGVAAGGSRMGR